MTQVDLIPDPRALSMTQPWAWMVVQPETWWKSIENRVKGFSHKSFRGDFLVHAAKACPMSEYNDACRFVYDRFGAGQADEIPDFDCLDRGGIIGAACAMGIVAPGQEVHELARIPGVDYRWHMSDRWGFELIERRPLPFVKCGGHLGFWRVPADVLAKIQEAA